MGREQDVIGFHEKRLSRLRTDRSSFESQWEEFAERAIPAHVSTFTNEGRFRGDLGKKNANKLLDATVVLALQRSTAVMESLTMPQNSKWHMLVPAEDSLRKNRQVRLYLEDLTRLLFKERYRARSNFIANAQKTMMSYMGYGNGMMFVDTNTEQGGLRYKNIPLSECYIEENHQGVVETMYRPFRLSYRNLVRMYGNAVPEKVAKKATKADEMDTLVDVLHVVTPRDEGAKLPPQMEYMSLHLLCGDQKAILRESGYRSFPLAVARYIQYVEEVYGRGPGQMVLPSIKVLNEQKKVVLTQGHRIVDPVLLTADDGMVGTMSLVPGAIVGGGVNDQGRALVQPLPTGNPIVGKDMMDDERKVINDAFLITLFQILVETPQMTATEVLERAREKGMLIAPTAGALGANFLSPMISRELDVLEAQGLLPPPPPALVEAGGEFLVEYDNPISRMARAENASGFMRSLQSALEVVAATQNPEPLDFFNFDEAMPAIMDINGAPVAWTNTLEKVQQIRAQRAQQAQTQQMIEAAPAMAGVMKASQGQ